MLTTALLIGAAIGLGAFTFVYAQGYSYVTNDPAACANCHIMDDHFVAWSRSSHAAQAVCNDCHTPHGSLLEKYAVKAKNGFWHSFYFTTGNFPDPIRITEANQEVVEGACRDCHEGVTEWVDHGAPSDAGGVEPLDCTRCHQYVGHMVR
jgi:cytochrome c nitrite reductase small subunit